MHMQKLGMTVMGFLEKARQRRERRISRKRELMETARAQHELWERDIDSVARMMASGDLENADKAIRNIRLSGFEVQHAAEKALVPAMLEGKYGRIREIVKRYGVEDNTVYNAATDAYEKAMENRYYESAIGIANGFGLSGKAAEPAAMLIQRNLSIGDEEMARKIAYVNGLQKEFGKMLRGRKRSAR